MKKDKADSPANPVDKYKAFLKAYLCTFQTAGRRCQMLGGHIDRGSENRLCSWHWLNQDTPQLLQDYEEFVRYRDQDRETYPKEWLQASLYIDDKIVWACILGKEQRKEFVRALRVVEIDCDYERAFGEDGRGSKKSVFDHPPP